MESIKTIGAYSKALQYLELGYSVIPVGKDKKATIKWERYQHEHPTEADLEEWFQNNPNNNIAIVTGKISGITVIDLDSHKGVNPADFPQDTYTVKTGNGGVHLYFQYHADAPTAADVFKDGKGVDVRNDGGYVVAPPSVIIPKYDGEDGVYMVRKAMVTAPFPIELLKRMKAKKKTVKERLNLTEGNRNDSIASLAGELMGRYHESKWETSVWQLVLAANATYNPPLPIEEVRTTFESIARRAKTNKTIISPVQFNTNETIDITLRKSKSGVAYKDMVNALKAFGGDRNQRSGDDRGGRIQGAALLAE
jgi:hypothetical protein